jgi:hypothetical protein
MTRKNIHLADTYASLSYGLGMDLIQVRPDLTEMLWTLSRDLYPDVGFIHVELASFYTYVRKDEAKVAEVFMICQKHESPRRQCQEQRIKEILPPGEFLHML